jgi:hypothetical protein
MQGISWPAEELLDSQAGICTMELVKRSGSVIHYYPRIVCITLRDELRALRVKGSKSVSKKCDVIRHWACRCTGKLTARLNVSWQKNNSPACQEICSHLKWWFITVLTTDRYWSRTDQSKPPVATQCFQNDVSINYQHTHWPSKYMDYSGSTTAICIYFTYIAVHLMLLEWWSVITNLDGHTHIVTSVTIKCYPRSCYFNP